MDSQQPGAPPPPIPANPPPATSVSSNQGLNWKRVLIDVAIVFGFTFVGGFVVGFIGGVMRMNPQFTMLIIAGSNLLMATIAFIISGCRAPEPRWPHLFAVAILAWIAGLVNLIFGIQFIQWMASVLALLVTMGIGGGISFLIRPARCTQ